MSLETLARRDVTILTAGVAVDRYGDTIPDWSTVTERPAKAWWAQQNTQSALEHRDGVVVAGRATFLLESQLVAGERVRDDAAGLTFEVVGQPNYAPTPRGPHHIEADLRAMVG